MTPADATPVLLRRPATDEDVTFIDELVFADALLVLQALPADQRQALAQLQVKARREGYARDHPHAIDQVLLHRDRRIGRLLLDESATTITIVDFRIATSLRNRGLGTAALADLCSAADERQLQVVLGVDPANSARHLYQRLGFRPEQTHPDEATGTLVLIRTSHPAGALQSPPA